MANSIKDLLQTTVMRSLPHDNKVFIHPHIPARKFAGAKSSYLPANVQPHDVLILIDDTVFGGSKEGLVLTEDTIYLKPAFEEPRAFLLNEIKSMAYDQGILSSALYINGFEVISFSQLEHKNSLIDFVHLVSNYIAQFQPKTASASSNYSSNQTQQYHTSSASTHDFTAIYPIVDILTHFALRKNGVWTSETVKLVKTLLEDFIENDAQMALLQARLKLQDRPTLDQSLKNFLRVTDDDDVKEFVIHAACEIAQLEDEADGTTLGILALMLGKGLGIDEGRLDHIYLSYVMDDQSTHAESEPHDEHVTWACTILAIAPQQITRETVQQAYRSKIKEFHPDKYQSLPESIQQMLNEKTQDLNKAKDILSARYS